eukprot:2144084-Pleurochrysis_carterae.AAC.1
MEVDRYVTHNAMRLSHANGDVARWCRQRGGLMSLSYPPTAPRVLPAGARLEGGSARRCRGRVAGPAGEG